MFGCSVATCRLACFEISFSINEKRLEKSPGKGRTKSGQSPNFIKNFTISYEKNLSTSILHIMFALLIRIYRAVARLQNKTRQDSSAEGTNSVGFFFRKVNLGPKSRRHDYLVLLHASYDPGLLRG